MVKDKAPDDKGLAVADIRTFMTERKEQAEASKRDVNKDNCLMVCPSAKQVECQTVYDGKVVHRQWLSKGEAAAKKAPPDQQGRQMLAPNPPGTQAENGPERQQPQRQQPQQPQPQQPKD
jgi:hypothetical protein